MKHFEFTVTDEYIGERIDKCISEMYEDFSRSYIQKLIKDKLIFVCANKSETKSSDLKPSGSKLLDSKPSDLKPSDLKPSDLKPSDLKPVKGSYILKEGDIVSFDTPDSVIPDILPEKIDLNILYEDDDVIIVNKPKGIVVHPAPGHYGGTLVNGLMYYMLSKAGLLDSYNNNSNSADKCTVPDLSGINGVLRPGIVHRIDMNTTGSLIICKNDKAHISIAEQLKEHSINRVYRAIVSGVLSEDEGTVNKPIGRNEKDRKKMAVNVINSKPAVTHYKVLKRSDKYSYIECKLETGRTHQIRVHMASIGHPVLGDDVYSNEKCKFNLEGQTLHAMTLGFIQPTTGQYIEVEAPLPEYFEKLLTILFDN